MKKKQITTKTKAKSARVAARAKILKAANASPGVREVMQIYQAAARYEQGGETSYDIESKMAELIGQQAAMRNSDSSVP